MVTSTEFCECLKDSTTLLANRVKVWKYLFDRSPLGTGIEVTSQGQVVITPPNKELKMNTVGEEPQQAPKQKWLKDDELDQVVQEHAEQEAGNQTAEGNDVYLKALHSCMRHRRGLQKLRRGLQRELKEQIHLFLLSDQVIAILLDKTT